MRRLSRSRMIVRSVSLRRQLGQTMTEYLIICLSLVGSFYWVANEDCEGYDNCISKLLTVMHDNYDGYSASVSAVQKYGDYGADVRESTWADDSDSGDGSGGGGGSTDLNSDGLTTITEVTDAIGFESYGSLQPDGSVVNEAGEIVGYYDDDTGVYTSLDGSVVINAAVTEVVLDEDGNVLQLSAVVECGTDPAVVVGFGYQSQASSKFFNSAQKSEIDIGSYCVEPSYKILDKEGNTESGRIVDGQYYAVTETIILDTAGTAPVGEVVYWDDLNICSVMISSWDSGVDTSQSAEDVYVDQLALFSEPDDALNPRIGSQDDSYYVEQTALYGEDTWPDDCVSSRTITSP